MQTTKEVFGLLIQCPNDWAPPQSWEKHSQQAYQLNITQEEYTLFIRILEELPKKDKSTHFFLRQLLRYKIEGQPHEVKRATLLLGCFAPLLVTQLTKPKGILTDMADIKASLALLEKEPSAKIIVQN